MGQTAVRKEAAEGMWGDLADSIARETEAAGSGDMGRSVGRGLNFSIWEEGAIVTWSTAEYAEAMVSPFEQMVEHAMLKALEQILQATWFTARIIPEGRTAVGASG